MVTLDAILASLARLEAGQMNILAAQDKIWQDLGALKVDVQSVDMRIDALVAEVDGGLKGTADGCGLAIAELRKEHAGDLGYANRRLAEISNMIFELKSRLPKKPLGTPQRGRKHSYRGKKKG